MFLQLKKVTFQKMSPKKSNHVVPMANSQTCVKIAMALVFVCMAKKSGYAFLVMAAVSACINDVRYYALNAKAVVSAYINDVRASAKIAGAVTFARTEFAKADVASVVAAKSVSTTVEMAIAKSAKDKVLF